MTRISENRGEEEKEEEAAVGGVEGKCCHSVILSLTCHTPFSGLLHCLLRGCPYQPFFYDRMTRISENRGEEGKEEEAAVGGVEGKRCHSVILSFCH
jgi:hypothetical protein